MVDIQLVLGVDVNPSFDEFQKGLNELKAKIDAKPLKIKVAPDGATFKAEFSDKIYKMLEGIQASAQAAIKPLNDISRLVSEINSKDFFNSIGRQQNISEYAMHVREYAESVQEVSDALAKISHSDASKKFGLQWNVELTQALKAVGTLQDKLGRMGAELSKSNITLPVAEKYAREIQGFYSQMEPFFDKLRSLGVEFKDPIPAFPEIKTGALSGTAAQVENIADAFSKVGASASTAKDAAQSMLSGERAEMQETSGVAKEHVTSMEAAKRAELEKATQSENLAGGLKGEASALNEVKEAASDEASTTKQSSDAKKAAIKSELDAYNDAKIAIKAYYDAQRELVRNRNGVTLTENGYVANGAEYDGLAEKLNKTKTAYDIVTDAANKSSLSIEHQAEINRLVSQEMDKLAQEIEKVARAEVAAADKASMKEATEAQKEAYSAATQTIKEYADARRQLLSTDNDIYLNNDGVYRSASGRWAPLANELNRTTEAYTRLSSAEEESKLSAEDRDKILLQQIALERALHIEQSKRENLINQSAAAEAEAASQKAAYQESINAINEYVEAQRELLKTSNDITLKDGVYVSESGRWADLAAELNRTSGAYAELTSNEQLSRMSSDDMLDVIERQIEAERKLSFATSERDSRERESRYSTEAHTKAINDCNTALDRATKGLSNWTAAEMSSNPVSREAYESLRKYRDALASAKATLERTTPGTKEHEAALDGVRAATERLNTAYKETKTTLDSTGDATKRFGDKIKGLAEKFTTWLSTTQLIMYAVRAVRKMIRESMELDTVMTQMQVVTKASAKEMEEFGKKAVESASRVGASVKDIVTASTTYARLGYNAEDSAKLAEYTTMLQGVGDIEADDAQNAVTAIIKAFDIDVDQIESVMDKLVAVGNHFPISVSQIAEGMNNASSTLHAAGNSFDQSVALLTAANTTVQNAAKAATGLRTIAARLRKTKTELDALGESMTDAQYEEIISALTKYGVTLKNTNGEFRSTYDILADLAKVWKTLGSEEQAALATTIANTRQQDIFYSVIENFQEASGAMDTMSNSAGELDDAFSKYMDSIQAHVNKFKTAFTELSNSTFTRDFLNGVIDFGRLIIEIFGRISKFINAIGGLNRVLYITLGIIATVKAASIFAFLNKLVRPFTALLDIIGAITSGAVKATIAGSGLGKTLTASFGSITVSATAAQIAVGAFVAVIGIALLLARRYEQEQKEIHDASITAAEEAKESSNSITELTNRYIEMIAAVDDGTSSQEDMISSQEDLRKSMHLEGETLQGLIDKYGDYSTALIAAARAKLQHDSVGLRSGYNTRRSDLQDEANKNNTNNQSPKHYRLIASVPSEGAKERYTISEIVKELGGTIKYTNGAFGSENFSLKYTDSPRSVEGLIEGYQRLEKILIALDNAGLSWTNTYVKISERYQELKPLVDNYNDSIADLNNNTAEQIMLSGLMGKKLPSTQEEFDRFREGLIAAAKASGKFVGSEEDIEDAVDAVLSKQPRFSQFISNSITGLRSFGDAVDSDTQRIAELEKQYEKLSALEKKFSALSSAYSDMVGSDGAVSFKSLSSIAEQFKDVDGIDNYIAKIATLRNDTAGLSSVMNDLLTDYVVQKVAAGELSDANEDVIEAMLREAGVANADKAAHDLLAYAKEKVAAKSVIESKGLNNVIDNLDDVSKSAGVSRSMLISLAAQMVKTNEKKMSFKEQIESLNSLAKSAGITSAMLVNAASIMTDLGAVELDSKGNPTPRAMQYLARIKNANPQKIIDDYVSKINDAAGTIKLDFDFSGAKTKKGNTEKSKKEVEEYLATIDKFRDAQKALDEATSNREAIEAQLERNHSLEEELNLRGQLADAYVAEQKALHNLNNVRDAEIKNVQSTLGLLGFSTSYDEKLNKFNILNPNNINQLKPVISEDNLKELKKLVKEYNKLSNGNVDYGKRPFVRSDKMRAAGWDDIEDGDIATILTNADTFSGEKYSFTIEYTPILENGEVLSKEAVLDYIKGLDMSGDIRKLLASDDKKLVVNVRYGDYDEKYWKPRQEKLDTIKEKHLDIAKSSGLVDLLVSGSLTDALLSADDPQEAANNYRKAVEELIKSAETWNESNGTGSEEWWKLQEQNIKNSIDALSAVTNHYENKISLTENWLNSAIENRDYTKVQEHTDNIASYYKTMQEKIHDQAQYYRALGYDNESDEVSQLSNLWWEYEQKRVSVTIDAWDRIVQASHESVDKIQDVYSTLQDAADEYAANGGFISVDTFQSIVQLGAQYMQYLSDENGLLVINRENINKVLAAKVQDLAVEEALAYVEKIRDAAMREDVKEVDRLTLAKTEATNATWGLIDAILAETNLTDEQRNAAKSNIEALKSITASALDGIGRVAGEASDQLEKMKSGVDDVLGYVEEMIKQRIEDQIDALEEMKDSYSEIIDLKKESLRRTKEEANYQKSLTSKVKEAAKIQAKIDALSFAADQGDRKAIAERASLQEELAKVQDDIADTQSDHAVQTQEDALDKMKDNYSKEKDQEIKELRDSISSKQKLYEMAVNYVSRYTKDNWSSLLSELKAWNREYGSQLETDIVSAWDESLKAAKRYGSYVNAITELPKDIENSSKSDTNSVLGVASGISETDRSSIYKSIREMQENSAEWNDINSGYTSVDDPEEQMKNLAEDNEKKVGEINEILLRYGMSVVKGINRKTNQWDGTWRINSPDGDFLYDYKFHNGGVVGSGGTKSDEAIALLRNKEWVLSEQMVNNLVAQMDRIKVLQASFDGASSFSHSSGLSAVLRDVGSVLYDKIANKDNQAVNIEFGDTIINGANNDTVKQHVEISRDMVNQIARLLRKTM